MARIKKECRSQSDVYKSINSVSKELGEKQDCTVIALTIASGLTYEVVHAMLKNAGRKERGGFRLRYKLDNILPQIGIKATKVDQRTIIDQYPGCHKNLKSITSHHPDRFNAVWPEGTYLMFTDGHVLAIKDGVNHDWSKGRALRCEALYKIESL